MKGVLHGTANTLDVLAGREGGIHSRTSSNKLPVRSSAASASLKKPGRYLNDWPKSFAYTHSGFHSSTVCHYYSSKQWKSLIHRVECTSLSFTEGKRNGNSWVMCTARRNSPCPHLGHKLDISIYVLAEWLNKSLPSTSRRVLDVVGARRASECRRRGRREYERKRVRERVLVLRK